MDADGILEAYDELTAIVNELNKQAPQIVDIYKQAKEQSIKTANEESKLEKQINAEKNAIIKSKKEIAHLTEDSIKSIESTTSAMLEEIKRANQKISENIKKQNDQILLIENQIDNLFKRLDSAIEKMDSIEGLIQTKLPDINSINKNSNKEIEDRKTDSNKSIPNYDDRDTMENLYKKYRASVEGAFVVYDKNWQGDYCRLIEDYYVEKGKNVFVWTEFKDGEPKGGKQVSAGKTTGLSLYNGPSKKKIDEYWEKNKQKKRNKNN